MGEGLHKGVDTGRGGSSGERRYLVETSYSSARVP